jgi:hypothetical protein
MGGAPVVYYPFDGDASDYSGNGLDGTLGDTVEFTTDCRGNHNRAVLFTSPDMPGIALGDHSEFNDLGNEFTIAFWVRLGPGNGGHIIDHDKIGTYSCDWRVIIAGDEDAANVGKVAFLFGNPPVYSDSRVDDGKWHHVAIRRDRASGQLWFFRDGVPDGVITDKYNDLTACPTTMNLGPYDLPGGIWEYGFVGALDDLRFYDDLLSDTAITDLAASCPACSEPPRGDLDGDCDVDLADFALFQRSFTGPSGW